MYLWDELRARAAAGRPVRVGLIGAGKFGSMFLSQVPSTTGLEVRAIADLDPDRARAACSAVGWDDARIAAVRFTDDAFDAVRDDTVDVVGDDHEVLVIWSSFSISGTTSWTAEILRSVIRM